MLMERVMAVILSSSATCSGCSWSQQKGTWRLRNERPPIRGLTRIRTVAIRTVAQEMTSLTVVENSAVEVSAVDPSLAAGLVIEHHYLHRRPPISHSFGLINGEVVGIATFGVPPSRHLQMSACPSDPDLVLELNRVWIDDALPRN